MKRLSFGTSYVECDGRRLRPAQFSARSALPVTAACVVAGGVRETLGALLGTPVALRLFEPCLPTPEGWSAIARAALAWRVRGASNDGAIVLRPNDARTLAAAAFGEAALAPLSEVLDHALSPMEADVLRRVVTAIAGNLTTVCGPSERPEAAAVEPVAAVDGFVTYFELQLDRPASACIGIALSREPESRPSRTISAGQLSPVSLTARVLAGSARVDARRLAQLRRGDLVPFDRSGALRATLQAGRRRIAIGEAGARDGRYAFLVRAIRAAA